MSDWFTPEGHISIKEVRSQLLDLIRPGGEKFTDDEISNLIEPFWFRDYHASIISIPNFFESFKRYILSGNNFSRIGFYQFFFNEILDDNELILKSLMRIGLVFERLQTNKLPKDKFIRIVEKQKLINIDWLLKQQLIIENENEYVWIHHTLTEYLTALLICQSKKPLDIAYKHAIIHLDEDDTDNIKPSWYGVIQFLLESKLSKEFLFWLVKVIQKNEKNLSDDLAGIITSTAPENLTSPEKKVIFDLIYDIYKARKVWLPKWTRHDLSRFYTDDQLARLKNDIGDTGDEVETYINKGNVVGIIDQLLRKNRITDREEWKLSLIKFANDDNKNGVLQRHSLEALSQFKNEPELIGLVKKNFNNEDSLVREAFVSFCYECAPNSNEAIDVMVEAVEGASTIYGRHGLYQVTESKAIGYLIDKFCTKNRFLEEFLDNESIFSGDKKEGDQQLVNRILDCADSTEEIKTKLNALVIKILESPKTYDPQKSYFIKSITKHFVGKDPIIIKLWIDHARSIRSENSQLWYLNNLEDLLPDLVNQDNYKKIFKIINESGFMEKNVVDGVVNRLRYRGMEGQELYELITGESIEERSKKQDQEEWEQNNSIYKEFLYKLEPAPKQYMTDVFEYYLNNKDDIKKSESDLSKEEERLVDLAFNDGIKRIDPRKFHLKIADKSVASKHYSWSKQCVFLGDMIRVVQLLDPDKLKDTEARQHIIDFIPFAHSEDITTIESVINEVKPAEVKWLHKVFLNKDDDRRYLVPDSLIYFINHLAKHSCVLRNFRDVLKSFINDVNIEAWIRKEALTSLGLISRKTRKFEQFLQKVFNDFKENEPVLAEIANEQLIEIFENEGAIEWRFDQLIARAEPFDEKSIYKAHQVSALENELDGMYFVSSLFKLTKPVYFDRFINLLQKILDLYLTDENYKSYFQYVWMAVEKFVQNQRLEKDRLSLLIKLEKLRLVNENKTNIGSWKNYRMMRLRDDLVDLMGAKL